MWIRGKLKQLPIQQRRIKMETSALKSTWSDQPSYASLLSKTRIKELKYLCIIFFQGYQGLVDGGDNIREAKWEEMSGIIQLVCIFVCRKYGKLSIYLGKH